MSKSKPVTKVVDRSEVKRLEAEQNMFDRAFKQLHVLDATGAVRTYMEKSKSVDAAIRRDTGPTEDGQPPPGCWKLHGSLHLRNLLHVAAMHGRDEALLDILEGVETEEIAFAKTIKGLRGRKKKAAEEDAPRGLAFCVNAPDEHGDTALMLAARGGHLECARLLLVKGGQPDTQNKSQHTAMHAAAQNDEREMLELLYHYDANPTCTTFTGYSPADLARKQGHLRTALWLAWAEEDWRERNARKNRRRRNMFVECACSYCAVLKSKGGNRDDPSLAVVGSHRVVETPGYTTLHDPKANFLINQAERRSRMPAARKDG